MKSKQQTASRVRSLAWSTEDLETRCLLSTITVTSLADNVTVDTQVTLREALQAANNNQSVDGSAAGQSGVQDQIVFQAGLTGTIQFASGQMTISDTVQITGLGATSTILNGNALSRVFYLSGQAGNVTLSGLTVTGGKTTVSSDRGGGISSRSAGTLTLINSVVSGNSTTGQNAYGGGVYVQSGGVTLTSSTVSGNSTSGNFGRGGGLFVSSGAVTLTNSTVSGNTTTGSFGTGAGIHAANGVTIALTNSTISGNSTTSASARGGGLYAVSGAVTLTNSTISGNSTAASSAAGGGLYSQRGNVTLNNSILAGNTTAVSTGADIAFINASSNATLTVRHSLIGNNQNTPLTAAPVGSPDANGNLIGTPAALIDPKLGLLADNGGPTLTRALLSGSPAINAGDNSLAVGLTTDQRGGTFARIVNGTVDMGAVEAAAAVPTVTLTVSPATLAEAAGASTVTATLSAVSGLATTVSLGFTGTATSGIDYSSSASQIVIPAGSLSGTITLTAIQDTLFEGGETIIVDITAVTNGTESGVQQVTATVVNDDAAPAVNLTISPPTLSEAAGQTTITATLSVVSGATATVFLGFTGTATNFTDYTRSAVQIVIPAGSLSGTITLTAVQDTLFEGNETVIVDITGGTNGLENGTQQVTATIIDDDTAPLVSLALSPATIVEAGGVSTVTATLSAVSGLDTTVSLGFAGTATNGSDYISSASLIVIPAGSLSASMTLTAVQDTLFESSESVLVDVTAVINGTENGFQRADASIIDDDAAPFVNLTLSPLTLVEAGGVSTVTATLSTASGKLTTIFLGFTGTATSGTDYTASATQIVIPPGSLSGTITLTAVQDTLNEGNETVIVDITTLLSAVENGTQQVTATIIDDDPMPTISITDVSVLEGNSGTINAVFTISLSTPSGQVVSVVAATADGTASAPGDYTALSPTTVTFAPGVTSRTVTVAVNGDTLFEAAESFVVNLSAAVAVSISDSQGVGTIINDDTAPTVTLSLAPATMAENGGSSTVTATQSSVSAVDTTVLLGFSGTATLGSDYTPSATQIVIPAGQLSASVTLTAALDGVYASNQTVIVDITGVTNGTEAGTQRVTATILDGDAAPTVTLAVNPLTLAENGGTTTLTATQSTFSALDTIVSLGFSGTANLGSDFTLSNSQIRIPAGQLSASITVTATLDGIFDQDETIIAAITGVTNGAESGVQQVTAMIIDGDTAPVVNLGLSPTTISEDGGNSTVTVTQSKLSTLDTTVTLLGTVTATNGQIIAPRVLQIVIPAGQLTGSFTFTATLDGVYANNLTVVLDIASVINGSENGTQQATGTIIDGDTAPTVNLTVSPLTLAENGGTTTLTATQSKLSALATTVFLGFSGTATPGSDYTLSASQIVIPAGQLSASIVLTSALDGVYATNETVIVDISGLTNGAENGTQQSTAIILDGDTAPTITLAVIPPTLAENGGSTTVTATQSKLSGLATIVALTFSGTATQGGDYTPSAVQIVIPAGQLTGSITLNALQDAFYEGNESIVVDISGVTNGTETAVQQVTATIVESLTAPTVTLAINPLTLAENGGVATLTATQSTLSTSDTTVFLIFSGEATAGIDYTLSSPQIVIPAGQLSAAVTLTAALDGVFDRDETIIVDISGVTNGAESGVQQVTATIIDGDAAPVVNLGLNPTTISEDGGSSTVTVTQSKLSTLDTTVTLLGTVTATNGQIIAPRVLQIVIPAGQLTGTFTFTATLDGVYANNLSVVLDITNVINGTENGTQQASGTIVDGDTIPIVNLTVSPLTLAENGGTTTLTATQSKLSALATTVFLGFSGTATQGIDYTLSAMQIVIPAGQLSASTILTATLDGVYAKDETVIVDISGVNNGAENGTQQTTATIIDGDTAPTITLAVSPLTLAENGGSTTVTATQTTLSAVDTTVFLAFGGTAIQGDDYNASAGQIVIPAGQLTGSITLTAVQDAVFEPDETIIVDVGSVANATETLAQQVTATIVDGAAAPTVTLFIGSPTLVENGGTTTVTATQSLLSVLDTTVFLGFSGTAIQGSNYTLSAAQIVIPAGQLSASTTLTALLDSIYAADHTVIVDISGITNGAESGEQQVMTTIVDGDTAPTVTLATSSATIVEDGGSATATATQSQLSALDTIVTLLATVTAANGEIIPPTVLQIVIPAGQLTGSFTYTSVLDGIYANDLAVVVEITGVTNGTELGTQQVLETIVDGDTPPVVNLTVSAPTVAENGGTALVTATQSKLSALDTTIFLGFSGTAILGVDYSASGTQVVIPAGQLSASVQLTAVLDGVYAEDEAVIVNISGVVNGTENITQQVTTTIVDGDTAPAVTLAVSPPTLGENGGSATVTATQSKLSAVDTIVFLAFSGTATQGDDYDPSAVQIVIPAGQLTGTIELTAVPDALFEGPDEIVVDIDGVINGTESGTQQIIATILDGQMVPSVTLAVSAPTLMENGGSTLVTASQSVLSVVDTIVFLGFSGTAILGTNFTLSAPQIVIPAGQFSASTTLTAILDDIYAQNHTVIVDISGVTNGAESGVQQVLTTIIDGSTAPTVTLSTSSATIAEDGGNATATATQSKLSALDTTVTLLATVTATNGQIIPPTVLQIVIPAGQLTGSFTYTSVLDGVYANDLSVNVEISGVTNGTELGTQQVLETVIDGDTPPVVDLTISAPTLAENGGTATVTATQTKTSALDTVVFLNFSGTAEPGTDFTLSAPQIVIPAGQLSASITLTAALDGVYAQDDTLIVDISGVTNGIEDGAQQVMTTIVDGDTAPTVTLSTSSATIAEDGGNATATATQSKLSALDTTVTLLATVTATNGQMIPPTVLQIVIPAGQLTGSFTYTSVLDGVYANDLNVIVEISGVTNGTELGTQQVLETVVDGDTPPVVDLTISTPTLAENGGTATVTATQSKLSALDTIVLLNRSGTGTSGINYTLSNTQIVIPAGQLTASITLTAELDEIYSQDNSVILDIAGVTNGIENGEQQVSVTIIDGTSPPTVTLSVTPLAIAENGGTSTVTATQSTLSALDTTVFLAFSGTATPGGDYTSSVAQIVIPAGQLTGSITLSAVADTLNETNETIIVDISSVTNSTPVGTEQFTVTIVDDDLAPTLSIDSITVVEGNSGTTAAVFTITLSQASGKTVTVIATSINGTASGPSDYISLPPTTLTFAPGETSKTVTVTVNGDLLVETNETYFVELTDATNAVFTNSQGIGTITDDDIATVSIAKVADGAETTPATNGTFRITQSAISATDTVVNCSFSGTATPGPGNDYSALSGTVTILAGQTTADIEVNVFDDALVEGTETVTITLTGFGAHASEISLSSSPADLTATVNITDDDHAIVVITSASEADVVSGAINTTVVLDVNANPIPGHTLTYSLSGADAAQFQINSATGEITFVTSPNFSAPTDQGGDNVYNVTVVVTADLTPPQSSSQALTITVIPTNNSDPVFVDASPTFSIPANSINSTVVGSVSATDADVPATPLTYSILSGNASGAFAIDGSTGAITVNDATQLDFAVTPSFTLIVQVTDNGSPTPRTANAVVVVNLTRVGAVITIPRSQGTYHLGRIPAFISPDSTFTFSEVPNPDYSQAQLTVSIVAGRDRRDRLSIFPQGNGTGQINIKGRRVFFGGEQIGKFQGGRGNGRPDLVVKFNSQATTSAVDHLMRRLNFEAARNVGTSRTINLQVTNIGGVDSNVATRELAVVFQD